MTEIMKFSDAAEVRRRATPENKQFAHRILFFGEYGEGPHNCFECGEVVGEDLNVHHKDGDHSNNDVSNLAAAHRGCHIALHHRGKTIEPWHIERVRQAALCQPLKTHCPQGHPYDEENTYITPSGRRQCRECKRESVRKHRREASVRN